MAGSNKALGALAAFFSVAEIAFAITIIVLVADQLWPGAGYYYGCYMDYSQDPPVEYCGTWYSSGFCLMTDNSVNVCRYSYAAAAIGIVASVVTMLAMCMPPVATLLGGLFGALWWLGYAITATVYSKDVNNQSFVVTLRPGTPTETTVDIPWGYPRGNYRTMVYALAWTTFSCCVVVMVLAVAMMKGKKEDRSYADKPSYMEEPVKPAGNPPAAVV